MCRKERGRAGDRRVARVAPRENETHRARDPRQSGHLAHMRLVRAPHGAPNRPHPLASFTSTRHATRRVMTPAASGWIRAHPRPSDTASDVSATPGASTSRRMTPDARAHATPSLPMRAGLASPSVDRRTPTPRRASSGSGTETPAFTWQQGWEHNRVRYRELANMSSPSAKGTAGAPRTDDGAYAPAPRMHTLPPSSEKPTADMQTTPLSKPPRETYTAPRSQSAPGAKKTPPLPRRTVHTSVDDNGDYCAPPMDSPQCAARLFRKRDPFADVEHVWRNAIDTPPTKRKKGEQSTLDAFVQQTARPDPPSSPLCSAQPDATPPSSVPGESSDDMPSPAAHWIRTLGSSPSHWYD